MNITAESIKKYRKTNNLTLEDMAQILGVSWRTVHNYEKGYKIPKTKNQLLKKLLKLSKEEEKVTTNGKIKLSLHQINLADENLLLNEVRPKTIDLKIQKSIAVLNHIIKDLKLKSIKEFSEKLELKRPEKLYRITRGQQPINKRIAGLINEKFPKYSIYWLLNGESPKEISYDTKTKLSEEEIKKIINILLFNEEELKKHKMYQKWLEIKRLEIENSILKELKL